LIIQVVKYDNVTGALCSLGWLELDLVVHMYADQVVEQQQQSRVVGYGKLKKMMDEARKVYPWLTELQVKSRAKRLKKSINRVLVDVTNNVHATTTVTRQSGRPKGSTDVAKKFLGAQRRFKQPRRLPRKCTP
jgi:succinate dehydrogenase flavin-adding protein (antitoxin of CptAB toxin-antitoxin module)